MTSEYMEKAKIGKCNSLASYSGIGINVFGFLLPTSFDDPEVKGDKLYEIAFAWTIADNVVQLTEWFAKGTKRGACVADALNAFKGCVVAAGDDMDDEVFRRFPNAHRYKTALHPCCFEIEIDSKRIRVKFTEEQFVNTANRAIDILISLNKKFNHPKTWDADFNAFIDAMRHDVKSGALFEEECFTHLTCRNCCTNVDSLTALMEHWEPTCD